MDSHANFAYTLVTVAPSPATTGTSLTVTDGSVFPTVPFNATVWPVGTQPLSTNAEIVRVTANSSNVLTITRQQESSSARTIIVGDQIAANITNKTFTDIETLLPTSGQQAALAGTTGTPGSGNKYVTDTDTRLSDSRTPSGAAAGVLSGTYPNPGFAVDMATQAELDAHTGLTTTAHGGIVASSDSRLTDARTPTAHATTHQPGGSDAMAVDAAAATGSLRTLGTGSTQAAVGADFATHTALTSTAHGGYIIPYNSTTAATTIAAPPYGGVLLVSGTTTINTMVSGTTGMVVQVRANGLATGVPVVLNHGQSANNFCIKGGHNLGLYARVPADTAISCGESLTFQYNGTFWEEIDRDLRSVLDCVFRTSGNQSVTATNVASPDTFITGSTMMYDGSSTIEYECWTYSWIPAGTNQLTVYLWESSTNIGNMASVAGTGLGLGNSVVWRRVPASGTAVAATIRAVTAGGTATIAAGTGGVGVVPPAYFKQTRSL